MFINYFKESTRESPFNIAVVRILLSLFTFWKLNTYIRWETVEQFPVLLHSNYTPFQVGLGSSFYSYEVIIINIIVLLFMIGYRTDITGFLVAFLIAHLSAILNMYTTGGTSTTFLYLVYFYIIFALYSDTDTLSIDGLRNTKQTSLKELRNKIQTHKDTQVSMDLLKWCLITFGTIYFLSGIAKVFRGPVTEWVSPENLRRYIQLASIEASVQHPINEYILQYDYLLFLGAALTIIFEAGFIFAILLKKDVSIFIIGLAGMHSLIALTMTPWFFDPFIIMLFFLPWDELYKSLVSDSPISVVYDDRCYFCIRSLYFIGMLDINNSIEFIPQKEYENNANKKIEQLGEQMHVVQEGHVYSGYDAFRTIFDHFGIFKPISFFMGLRPVSYIGEKVYSNIAANRNTWFVCSVENEK